MKNFLVFVLSMFLVAAAQAEGFSNTSEASVVVTGGNTDLQVYSAKTLNTYKQDKNTYNLSGHYTYGTSDEALSARNWSFLGRYDRNLTGKWGVFAAYQYEQDKFRGFDFRQNHDLGGTFAAYTSERQTLNFELGYRLTREKSISLLAETESLQKTRYASTYEFKAVKNWSVKFVQELLLNHTRKSDTIYTAEPSLNMALSDKVSFKFGYRGIYENQPSQPGFRKYDYQFTSGLIANF